jgi:preprotein translocase subunit SecD
MKPADRSWDESPKPAPGQSGANQFKLELHRAEDAPAEGLTESAVLGRPEKIYLHPEAELTNADIAGASVTTDDNGKPVVSVALTVDGAKKMAELSKSHLHKPLAIMLDGRVVLAPRIMSEMSGGVQINGNLTKEAAEKIAMGLNGK